jgi:hypothetical protein
MKGKKMLLSTLFVLLVNANLANAPQIKAASPKLIVTSVYNIKQPGMTFLVNITVTDVEDLFMWAIDLSWDPNIIQISTGDPKGLYRKGIYYNIYEGPFLKSVRPTLFLVNDINNTGGTITSLSATYTSQGATASGSGILAIINFTSVNVGTTTIQVTRQALLIDHTGKNIPHEDVSGVVTEAEPPSPPPIWTQLWFQLAVIIIVAIIAIGYVWIKVIIPVRERAAEEEEEIVE